MNLNSDVIKKLSEIQQERGKLIAEINDKKSHLDYLKFAKVLAERDKMFFTEFLPFMGVVLNETNRGRQYGDSDALEFITKKFDESRIFVVPPLASDISHEIDNDRNFDPIAPLDLPFDNCYFEMPKGFFEVGIVNQTDNHATGQILLEKYRIVFLIVWEIESKNFIFSYGFRNEELPQFYSYDERDLTPKNMWLKKLVWGVLRSLKSSVLATEKIMIRQKARINGTNIHSKIKEVIHVLPSKKYPIHRLSATSEIDWSHRWEVRGHWRRITGMGKDRRGNYGVNGFTWVSSHERGPDDKPLVKKVRNFSIGKEQPT